jgi:hypothetical protein
VSPTSHGVKGQVIPAPESPGRPRVARTSFWAIDSRLDPEQPLASHLEDITSQLGSTVSLRDRIPAEAELFILVSVITEGICPLISLNHEVLVCLARLDAELRIDVS